MNERVNEAARQMPAEAIFAVVKNCPFRFITISKTTSATRITAMAIVMIFATRS